MARGRFRPRRARRGDATRSVGNRRVRHLSLADVAGWAKGGTQGPRRRRTIARLSGHAALRVIGANLQELEAEHTPRHPASGRFNDRGAASPRRGRCRASERVSKRHRHEIAAGTARLPVRRSLCWGRAVLDFVENFPNRVFCRSRKPETRMFPRFESARSADSGGCFGPRDRLENSQIWPARIRHFLRAVPYAARRRRR